MADVLARRHRGSRPVGLLASLLGVLAAFLGVLAVRGVIDVEVGTERAAAMPALSSAAWMLTSEAAETDATEASEAAAGETLASEAAEATEAMPSSIGKRGEGRSYSRSTSPALSLSAS